MGRIPTLIDGDLVLNEAAAILPAPGGPASRRARAGSAGRQRCPRQAVQLADLPDQHDPAGSPALRVCRAAHNRSVGWCPSIRAKSAERLDGHVRHLRDRLAGDGPWLLGGTFKRSRSLPPDDGPLRAADAGAAGHAEGMWPSRTMQRRVSGGRPGSSSAPFESEGLERPWVLIRSGVPPAATPPRPTRPGASASRSPQAPIEQRRCS